MAHRSSSHHHGGGGDRERQWRQPQAKNTVPLDSTGYRYMSDQGRTHIFHPIMLGDEAKASPTGPALSITNGRRQEPPARTFLKQATSSNPEVIATVPTRRSERLCTQGTQPERPLPVKSASSGCVVATGWLRTAETAAESFPRYRCCVSAGAECIHGCTYVSEPVDPSQKLCCSDILNFCPNQLAARK